MINRLKSVFCAFVFSDDFADSTPPVSKKQKLSNKENKEKKRDKQTVKVQSKAKDRR